VDHEDRCDAARHDLEVPGPADRRLGQPAEHVRALQLQRGDQHADHPAVGVAQRRRHHHGRSVAGPRLDRRGDRPSAAAQHAGEIVAVDQVGAPAPGDRRFMLQHRAVEGDESDAVEDRPGRPEPGQQTSTAFAVVHQAGLERPGRLLEDGQVAFELVGQSGGHGLGEGRLLLRLHLEQFGGEPFVPHIAQRAEDDEDDGGDQRGRLGLEGKLHRGVSRQFDPA
jgi:hypothetical protein